MRILDVLKLSMTLLALGVTTQAQAEPVNNKIFLSSCFNSGSGVSFSFSSCVNRNFNEVARELGGFYSYCSNFGDEVSFSFISCISRNFNNAERESQGKIFLRYCSNIDRTRLSYSYVSCVNSNFREIERYLNSL
jgi:hypothetical protein